MKNSPKIFLLQNKLASQRKETQSHSQTHDHYVINSTEPYLKENYFYKEI